MTDYRVISSDSHVIEPEDLWTAGIEPRFRERGPRIVRVDGYDWWFCDDQKVVGLEIGTQGGVRFDSPDQLHLGGNREDVPLGGYIPGEHVKDMNAEGVDANLLYPSIGFMLFNVVTDSELLTACFTTYNEWVAEFCRPFANRLKPIALVNIDDVGDGVRQLERYANMGFVGAMIPTYPHEGRGYNLPEYEPLWAAAQDLEMPLSLHVVTNRPSPGNEFSRIDNTTASFEANRVHWVKMSLGHMILHGVFERYPRLQVGSVEFELGWVPHFLNRLDYIYTQGFPRKDWHKYKEDMLPSEFFHRNVFVSFQEDALGIRLRDMIGVDSILWGSDYPHPEGTWPRSREILEEILSDCTEEEKTKIAGGNAARVYRID